MRAYNYLMQFIFKSEAAGGINPNEMTRLWGALLLAIRKSFGNKKTDLDEWDMLEGFIKDMDALRGPRPREPARNSK